MSSVLVKNFPDLQNPCSEKRVEAPDLQHETQQHAHKLIRYYSP